MFFLQFFVLPGKGGGGSMKNTEAAAAGPCGTAVVEGKLASDEEEKAVSGLPSFLSLTSVSPSTWLSSFGMSMLSIFSFSLAALAIN